MRTGPVDPLDRLAIVLGDGGLACARRGDGDLPRLRVWHPALPVVGESVSIVPGPGGTPGLPAPWFRCSSGNLIAPCGDLTGAVTRIMWLLAPFVPRSTPESRR